MSMPATFHYTEYVYRNAADSIRVKIFKRESGYGIWWDYDVFERESGRNWTFSDKMGDVLYFKREAKADAEARFGKLISINPEIAVTAGWGGGWE